MPVAQIVAGFTKVFVGEMVEKGECRSSFYLSPRGITAPPQLGSNHRIGSQLVQSRSAAEKRDPCLQITCARRTACTRRRPGALAPLGHYAGKSSSRAKRVMDLETPPLPPSRTLQAITRTPIDVSQVDMKYPPHSATPVSNTRRIKELDPDSTFALRGVVLIQRIVIPGSESGELRTIVQISAASYTCTVLYSPSESSSFPCTFTV
jgi:hypothetical protein